MVMAWELALQVELYRKQSFVVQILYLIDILWIQRIHFHTELYEETADSHVIL